MGLRCLLGHDFTEPTTDRVREERGDEVVTTVREVKECTRCGETQVISENTEVTSIGGGSADVGSAGESGDDGIRESTETASDVGAGEDATVDDSFDHPRGDPADVDPTVEDDAEIIREGPADAAGGESDGRTTGQAADGAADESVETAGEESAATERAHGEWPASDTADAADGRDGAKSPREWPDPDARPSAADDASNRARDAEDPAATEARTDIVSDAERSGIDDGAPTAAPEDEDVEFIDADGSEPSGAWPEQEGEDEGFDAEVGDGRPDENVTVDGNLTPRVNPNAEIDEDAEFIEASPDASQSPPRGNSNGEASSDVEIRSSNSPASPPPERAKNGSSAGRARAEPSTPTHEVELTTTVGEQAMEYRCPECGKRERVGASSMRAGDICPECKRGYIEEHELE